MAARGLRDAAVDLALLSRADLHLISPMSSFGGFAHGAAAAAAGPWRATAFGECVRGATSEPFFHHWRDAARQLAGARGATIQPSEAVAHVCAEGCGLPDGFVDSEEARSLGHWLLGGEADAARRQALFDFVA